MYEKTSADMHK